MKKIVLTGLFSLALLSGFSQNCNIGNQVETSDFGTGSVFGKERITGNKFTLSQEGTLKSINYIGWTAGTEMKMAVYSDKNGEADTLITSTAKYTIVKGFDAISVTPLLLPAGDYWICAVYKDGGGTSKMFIEPVGVTKYCGAELLFDDEFPKTSAGFSYYNGLQFLYSMSIDCGNTLSLDNIESSTSIEVYPNPTTSYVRVSGVKSNTAFFIADATGKTVTSGVLNETNEINTLSLTSGLYFIYFNGVAQAVKLVK